MLFLRANPQLRPPMFTASTAMQALFVAWYNLCRKHEALKGNTPGMASKLTDHIWTIKELIEQGQHLATFWFLITVSGLPLIAYPAVLLAIFMALAAPKENESLTSKLAIYGFALSTMLYPVVFFVCGAKGWDRAHWGTAKATTFWALAPLLYVAILVAVVIVAGTMSPHEQFAFPTP